LETSARLTISRLLVVLNPSEELPQYFSPSPRMKKQNCKQKSAYLKETLNLQYNARSR